MFRPRGLAVKLALAFAGVAVVAVVLVAVVVSQATTFEFGSYLSHVQAMRQMMGERATTGMMGRMVEMMGAPEAEFLAGVNRAAGIAAVVAVLLAVGLGLFLARRMVLPLRRLIAATQRIAGGSLKERVAVTSQDEIGELATSFNAMAAALERNEQLCRNMVADIAHELRTPLSILQAKLEALQDGVAQPTLHEIASLHEEVLLLARLVTDLRTLSLAEAGQLDLRRERVDLAALAHRAIEGMRPQADNRGLALSLDAQPGVPLVMADPDRVFQVLGNLLSNALRYTPRGGRITVRVAVQEGQAHLAVADTGPGIPTEDMPHIFERFYRADRSRSRSTGGSGLGLSIVKQLVEAMGGHISVESAPGQGTTFRCSFSPPQEPRPAHATPPVQPRLSLE